MGLHTCPICFCARSAGRTLLYTCRSNGRLVCQTHTMCRECWARLEGRPCPQCRGRTSNPRKLDEVLPSSTPQEISSTLEQMRREAAARRIGTWARGLSRSQDTAPGGDPWWQTYGELLDAPEDGLGDPHGLRDPAEHGGFRDAGHGAPPEHLEESEAPEDDAIGRALDDAIEESERTERSVPPTFTASLDSRAQFITAELQNMSRRMRWQARANRLAGAATTLREARELTEEIVRHHTPAAVRQHGGTRTVAEITGVPAELGMELGRWVEAEAARTVAAAAPTEDLGQHAAQVLCMIVHRMRPGDLPAIVDRLLGGAT